MHQITLFQDKKSKNFQTPPAVGREISPPYTPPLGVYGASFNAEGRLVF